MNREEIALLISALNEYKFRLVEDMCGDDRDDWAEGELQRIQTMSEKLWVMAAEVK